MKECVICGHAAQRGSICHDCRAALKRARDQTVSQFQALPGLALAGAASVAGAAHSADARPGRSAPDRRGGRASPPRARPSADKTRKPRVPMAPVQGSVLLEIPPGTRSAPFVWVIVTLMVFVVTYVAYRVFTTASETAIGTQGVAATVEAGERADAPAVDSGTVAIPGTPSLDPAAAATPVQKTEPSPPAVPSSPRRELETAPHAPEPIKTAPAAKPAERRAAVTAPADARTLSPSKDVPRIDNAVPAQAPVSAAAAAKVATEPAAESRAARKEGAAARPREVARSDHWQGMANAIRACTREDFLGGVLCEQKVRIEYCEGYWGQVPECPGGVPNDHGQ